MRQVSGFTLIELIVVIAILAILAATALPKFLDLRAEALIASANGIAGSVASGTAINFSKRLVTAAGWSTVSACSNANLASVVQGNVLPTGVSIAGTAGVLNGATGTCTLEYSVGAATATVTFFITGAV
jgi:MSHA pilin protein MshA